MTIDELVTMCNEFHGKTVKECEAIGNKYGVCRRHVDVLRHLLCITLPKAPLLDKNFIQQIKDLWNSDPNITGYDIGRKLNYSYQTVYKILRRLGYNTNRKRENWTVFSARRLLYARNNLKMSWSKVPAYVGNNLSKSACQHMYEQLTQPDKFPTRSKGLRIALGLQQPDPEATK